MKATGALGKQSVGVLNFNLQVPGCGPHLPQPLPCFFGEPLQCGKEQGVFIAFLGQGFLFCYAGRSARISYRGGVQAAGLTEKGETRAAKSKLEGGQRKGKQMGDLLNVEFLTWELLRILPAPIEIPPRLFSHSFFRPSFHRNNWTFFHQNQRV